MNGKKEPSSGMVKSVLTDRDRQFSAEEEFWNLKWLRDERGLSKFRYSQDEEVKKHKI